MNVTLNNTADAEAMSRICEHFDQLIADPTLSRNVAARIAGRSGTWFSRYYPRWQRDGAAAFIRQPRPAKVSACRTLNGQSIPLPDWFVPVAKFFNLIINCRRDGGSVREAIRRTINLPRCAPGALPRLKKVFERCGYHRIQACPPDLRDAIQTRDARGMDLLPDSVKRLIAVPLITVHHRRHPTRARLRHFSTRGTMMWMQNPETGGQEFIRAGQVIEVDDGTINFPCVLDWPMRGCPCSERFGVKVGRFQFLLTIDAGSRFVPGYSYTCRPKSSYRAEDLVAVMGGVVKRWGIPQHWRMEQGISASHLVKNAITKMGSNRWGVYSPRQKPFIEGLFNKLWTYLSVWFPDAQVGRFRGETEEANLLLTACQAGRQDPRRHFPTLPQVIQALDGVIQQHNDTIIRSDNYGSWIPRQRWLADLNQRPLGRFSPANQWILSPFVRAWRVRGNGIGGRVPFMPGYSVPYEFQHPDLCDFHGARVEAYFDPAEPKCSATVVLTERFGPGRRGQLICVAPQVNQTTEYIRMLMGWGEGESGAGRRVLRQTHHALVRHVRAIDPYGRHVSQEVKVRDGLGAEVTLTRGEQDGDGRQGNTGGRGKGRGPKVGLPHRARRNLAAAPNDLEALAAQEAAAAAQMK